MNQTQILRNMSPGDRLKQALQLSDFVRELTLKNIKNQYPNLSKKAQIKKLQQRLLK